MARRPAATHRLNNHVTGRLQNRDYLHFLVRLSFNHTKESRTADTKRKKIRIETTPKVMWGGWTQTRWFFSIFTFSSAKETSGTSCTLQWKRPSYSSLKSRRNKDVHPPTPPTPQKKTHLPFQCLLNSVVCDLRDGEIENDTNTRKRRRIFRYGACGIKALQQRSQKNRNLRNSCLQINTSREYTISC